MKNNILKIIALTALQTYSFTILAFISLGTIGIARAFDMGFVAVPAQPITTETWLNCFNLIKTNGEFVSHLAVVDWESFKDSSNPTRYQTTTPSLAFTDFLAGMARLKGINLFVTVDPLKLGRLEIDDKLPSAWGKNFGDPNVRTALKNFAARIARDYKPAYMGIYSEINTYIKSHPEDAANVFSLYAETYAVIKSESPFTQVTASFQFEVLSGTVDAVSQWEIISSNEAYLDLIAITTYPGLYFETPEVIPDNYYNQIKTYTSKPVIIAESGWPSGGNPAYHGNIENQMSFLKKVAALTDNLDLKLWVWWFLHDYAVYGDPFDTMGLRTSDSTEKQSWLTWQEIHKEELAKKALKWAAIRDADKAQVPSAYNDPVWVAGVNSTGYEDGAYISANGNKLFFTYTNIDLFKLPQIVFTGPDRDPSGIGIPPLGQFPRADVFYSSKYSSGKWTAPIPHPLTIPHPIGGFVLADENTAYFSSDKGDGLKSEICFAERKNNVWQSPQKISALSSQYQDDDPYVTRDNQTLYFWSDRPDTLSGNNIYCSHKIDNEWQPPVMLPEPINSDSNDLQPFLFRNDLYFTSNRDGVMKIYKSSQRSASWSPPELVLSSKYGVGEPTITDDGKYIYFVQVFVSEEDGYASNLDVMYIKRIPKAYYIRDYVNRYK